MKVTHSTLARFAACIWLAIASFLLWKGISLLEGALKSGGGAPLKKLTHWAGGAEVAVSFLVAVGAFLGFLKGKFALNKSARRFHRRILSLPEPAPLYRLFSPFHYLILLAMVGLGMGMRFYGTASEIRGTILVAVSAALLMGSLTLLRLGRATYDKATPT